MSFAKTSIDLRRFLFILSILVVFGYSITCYNCYISNKGDTELVEYYLNGVSPGFQKESLFYSTFLNDNIFVTTSENGHVYKVSVNENKIVHDYGSVGYDLYYDLKQAGPLVNDGRYIYGSIYPNSQLFYLDPATDQSFPNTYELLDQSKLKENSITQFYDAEIFEEQDHKYVLIGAKFNNQNKKCAKFVKWDIADSENMKKYEVVTLNGYPQFVEDIEIANFIDERGLKKCVYLGITSQNNHHLEYVVVYDILLNKILFSLDLTIPKYKNAFGQIRNLSADKSNPGVIWLFERTESDRFPIKITRFDINTQKYFTQRTSWKRPYNKYYFKSLPGKIITNHAVIKTEENFNQASIERYNPPQNADLHSFNILFDGEEMVYGIDNSRGLQDKYIYKVNLLEGRGITKNLIPEPNNYIKKNPSGGGALTSLLVNNKNVIGSLHNTFIEMKTNRASNSWTVDNINGSVYTSLAVQADNILLVNNEKYGQVYIYGLYSGPFIRIKTRNNDEFIEVRKKVNLPTHQVRIKDMKQTNDGQVIMATGTGDQSNDHACLLRFDLNEYLSSGDVLLEKLGETNHGYAITQIDYQFYDGKHRVVGTVLASPSYGIFVYDIPSDWKNREPKIFVNVVSDYWPSSINIYKKKIFVAAYHSLWTFESDSISVSEDFSFKEGFKGVKLYKYLFNYESNKIKPLQLILGNNNKMYCYSEAYLFEFDPEDIGTAYPNFNITKYSVQGYNPTTTPGLKISCLTKDEGNRLNYTIYAGTYVGRIFTLNIKPD